MATQQILFGETVASMKKALKRKAYESDSDDSIEYFGNRGHKLKKRALFARQGQLAPPSGPEVYKQVIDYAGHRRTIISRNPPLVDDDGYEIESDDDEERVQDAMAAAAEIEPYANIRLEQVLAPLTASTDLPTHPTLSRPFTTKTLTELSDQSCDIMRKENKSLWRVRHLLTKLCGDYTWAPCGMMMGSNDVDFFSDDYVARNLLRDGKASTTGELEGISPATLNGETKSDHLADSANGDSKTANHPPEHLTDNHDNGVGDVSMTDAEPKEAQDPESGNGKNPPSRRSPREHDLDKKPVETLKAQLEAVQPAANGDSATKVIGDSDTGRLGSEKGTAPKNNEKQDALEGADIDLNRDDVSQALVPVSHAATDIAERNGTQALSITSDAIDGLFVHPFFLPPQNGRPDRDLGLPEQEAEDIRRLLALYVQKQEEVCRGASKLYEGLLKADRLRKTVLKWSKSEAHSGTNRDMSDGEDWYDKDEWGLTEDLRKGLDDEEEDIGPTTKKTRNRRYRA